MSCIFHARLLQFFKAELCGKRDIYDALHFDPVQLFRGE